MPVSGAWKLTYNLQSRVDSGEQNIAYLFINGDQLDETEHKTYSGSDFVRFTSGRVVTLEVSVGDKIEIRTTRMENWYYKIMFCAEYIQKM